MQNAVVDQKVARLYERYQDQEHVATSQRDIEAIRNKASTMGLMTSVAIFGLNEVARLTMRSPMFKLKVQNVAFFALAPTLLWRYSYNQAIDDRIEQLWRVHQNRVEKGLGGTSHDDQTHHGDSGLRLTNGFNVRFDSLSNGILPETALDNPFVRWNETIEQNSNVLHSFDDEPLYKFEKYERLRHTDPDEKKTVGVAPLIPREDNDEKWYWSDIQGETIYSNPPDPNLPVVDTRCDEEKIWNFRITNFNQSVIKNDIALDPNSYMARQHAPWWGQKLRAPAFYTDEKLARFYSQWAKKQKFELLKGKHAIELAMAPNKQDPVLRKKMESEVAQFLDKAKQEDQEEQYLSNVYTTDHVPKQKKFNTLSGDEDRQFFEHLKRIEEYNKDGGTKKAEIKTFEKGSLLQRITDPLANAVRLENGTRFYELSDQDFGERLGEASLRSVYEKRKDLDEQVDTEDDDQESLRTAYMQSMSEEQFEEWNAVLDRELGKFAKGEKYEFVKDLRKSYSQGLATSEAEKIFKTIPTHVFYDIKKPLGSIDQKMHQNSYNPNRAYQNVDFFDTRSHEQWIREKDGQRNINTTISKYRRY